MYQINRRSLVIAALNCATGIFLTTAAMADSETLTSSGQLGPVTQADSIALPSFNSDLGTLKSVVITMQFNLCPTVTITNSTTAPLEFSNLAVTAPFSVNGPGGLTYNNTLTSWYISGTVAPGSTNYTPKSGWIYAVEGANASSLALWENQPGNDINLVVTPGTLGTTGTPLPAGLQSTTTAQEWENFSVKYTYLSTTAAPEPSGTYFAFIVGSMMAVFVAGRRMRLGA
jgi:hypothetical protein